MQRLVMSGMKVGGLTLPRIATGCPWISWSRGLLFGEADDAGDFTTRSKSPPFHLACISNKELN